MTTLVGFENPSFIESLSSKDVAGDMADFDSPFDTLATLGGVLSSDEEMVSLYWILCTSKEHWVVSTLYAL